MLTFDQALAAFTILLALLSYVVQLADDSSVHKVKRFRRGLLRISWIFQYNKHACYLILEITLIVLVYIMFQKQLNQTYMLTDEYVILMSLNSQ